MMPDRISLAERAAWQGKTVRWVRAQCRAGRMPHHRDGRDVWFTAEDVERYLTRTAQGTAKTVASIDPRTGRKVRAA